jgi:hypothetical protein
MKNEKRSEYLTRDGIMKLLSDEEVSRVSTKETAVRLATGDEYLDLERLDRGVQKAHKSTTAMGLVLARSAVHANTWNKIVAQLAELRITAPRHPAARVGN